MVYTIGYVSCQTYLWKNRNIGSSSLLLHMLQELLSLSLIICSILIIINHIQSYQTTIQASVAHHYGEIKQRITCLWIFHRNENLLIITLWFLEISTLILLLLQNNGTCSIIRHDGWNDTSEENHYHHAIKHAIIKEILTRTYFQFHANHYNRNSTGSMGRGETEHEMPLQPVHTEYECAEICS